MGLNQSKDTWENPVEAVEATLYYFAGRGVADQVRWLLAATNVTFTQKIISKRGQLLKMAEKQLPFGELPLLQIDGMELVQSQVMVRYLAKRGGLVGANEEEQIKCDMIAECVRDLLGLAMGAPFKRCGPTDNLFPPTTDSPAPPSAPPATTNNAPQLDNNLKTASTDVLESIPSTEATSSSASNSSKQQQQQLPTPPSSSTATQQSPAWLTHLEAMKKKWSFVGARFEAILRANNLESFPVLPSATAHNKHTSTTTSQASNTTTSTDSPTTARDFHSPNGPLYLVGKQLTYADILVAHTVTWYVEECGVEIVQNMPNVVYLQNQIISMPSIKKFIQSSHYFPIGDQKYVDTVRRVLARNIT